MELKQYYNKAMGESINLALATSVGNRPNVRVVTFGYDAKRENRLYFSTFRGCKKTEEFAENPQVACVPLPPGPEAEVQVRIFGRVQKAELTIGELVDMISQKAPGDGDTMLEGADMLEIYEVRFAEAWVTVGMTEAECYTVDA